MTRLNAGMRDWSAWMDWAPGKRVTAVLIRILSLEPTYQLTGKRSICRRIVLFSKPNGVETTRGGIVGNLVMNLRFLVPLALPFACLALLSFIAFLGVMALAGALCVIGAVTSMLGLGRKEGDPWYGSAEALDYVEAGMARRSSES